MSIEVSFDETLDSHYCASKSIVLCITAGTIGKERRASLIGKSKTADVDVYVFESFVIEYREYRASGGRAISRGNSGTISSYWRDTAGIATAFVLDSRRSEVIFLGCEYGNAFICLPCCSLFLSPNLSRKYAVIDFDSNVLPAAGTERDVHEN